MNAFFKYKHQDSNNVSKITSHHIRSEKSAIDLRQLTRYLVMNDDKTLNYFAKVWSDTCAEM